MYRHAVDRRHDTRKVWWFLFAFLLAAVFIYPSYGLAKNVAVGKTGVSSGFPSWAWISVKDTHVRQQPTVKSQSLEILRRGQLINVLRKGKGWTEVQYELGKTGWIFNKNFSSGLPVKMARADRILLVKGNAQEKKGIVEIYFNGTIGDKIKVFEMRSPFRIIVDLAGLKSPRNKTYSLGKSAIVSEIKIGVHPDKSRLVLAFDRKISKFSHSIASERNAVSLALLLGTPEVHAAKSTPKIKKVQKKEATAKETKSIKPVRIVKTGFRDEAKQSSIILNATAIPSYYIKFKKGKVGLILSNTTISKRYTRFLNTSGFPTPIKKVEFRNVFDPKEGRKAEVWVTTSAMVPYDVVTGHRTLKWVFQKPAEFVAQYREAQKSKAAEASAKPQGKSPVKAVSQVQKKTKVTAPQPKKVIRKKKYTGAKMTFDFQKADIHNVLRLIAEVSNLNIVAGDDVRGKITLRLKNVPWDQALDIILQSRGLGKEQIGNVLRIAPRAKLKKEMQEKISSRKVVEKLEARVTEYIPVNYTTAKDLSIKVKPMLSSRGTVTVDERTNTLIIKDIPKKVKDIKSLVKRLDTPTPEVLIESRIVEANKDFTREFGIKWGITYNADTAHGNPFSSNFPNAVNVRGGATGQAGGGTATGTTGGTTTGGGLLPMVNLPATASYGAIGISLEQLVDIFTLDAELTAMEDNGKGRVISSPRIATLDNKPAKIEQGLRIPYLKITEEGTVTTEFIEANLNMEVTPHVSNDKMVNMEIKVSKDTPDWSHLVQGVPSIDKKEATTNVMVRDGGVTAIGGIFTIEKSNTIHKVPLFGDIPVLGWAFKNKRVVKNRKELLIFISPKLIPLKEKR